jgi:hypothetical protein
MASSFNHPVINSDDWRDIPKELQTMRTCKGGLGDIIPLATNGVVIYGLKGTLEFIAHCTNVPDFMQALHKLTTRAPREPKTVAKKERKVKSNPKATKWQTDLDSIL